ncbi:MAG TPA: hypothetical protein PKK15_11535 [Kouleothrix sp.]|uniref:hypothetical protein n=1 Tax=Kouleothrix sp. TaxID=2779161 RepID=UPI002C02C3CA|nr:hypothetical protein [Kouleothrix sp.]
MIEYDIHRLRWLHTQLAEGWRLEGPVIERLVYRSAVGQVSAFEFVLRHERGCQVLAINDCPEVRSFMSERRLDSVLI